MQNMISRLVLILLSVLSFQPNQAEERPANVVFILVDNQGYFELACKGNPYVKTPHIDRFANEGVDFCNFHAENFCSPSRAALLTGLQPMRLGVHNTVGGVSLLDPDRLTLADRLRKAGYRTGIFGKWHLGMSHPFHPSQRGFDEVFVHGGGGIGQLEDYAGNNHLDAHFQHNGKWIKSSGFSTDVLFDQAIRFISSSKEKPFFCFIPTPAVHFPVQAEPKTLARIKSRGVTEEQTNLSRLSMIENLDDNLGRMVAFLDKSELRENTLIVFMTDQGVGDRGSPAPVWPGKDRQKDLGNSSEGKHRVFCMVQKPGLTVAGPNQALTCIRDMFPTVLDICGVKAPDELDGRSLVPLLGGEKDWEDDRVIVMQCPRNREREKWKHAAVKQGDWRLVQGNRLYNIESDSLMKHDLSKRHPEIAKRLNAAYERFWASLPLEEDLVQRHVLGASEAPKTLLCAMDWREGGAPWNSGALRDGFRGQGAWYVTVETAGRYRVTLCRAMKQTPLAMRASQGTVTIGPFSAKKKMNIDDTECVIEMDLSPGDYKMMSFLQSPDDPEVTWGANFAYVELLKPAQEAASKHPNILFILADDLGYGDVSCYNPQSKVPTPNLDKLASQGMRFTDAHSASTVCTPTRYSLMTGRMCFRTGYRGVFTGVGGPCLIEPERLTLPEMLKDVGYSTAMFGKWHIGLTAFESSGEPIHKGGLKNVQRIDFSHPIAGGPVDHGFDRFYGTACCPTTDWLYAYIDGNRVPVPPTRVIDKSTYPRNSYTRDFRPGMAAANFDASEVDLVFLKKSQEFLREHVRSSSSKPFFLFHSMQAVHLPSIPAKLFRGKTEAGPHGDFIHQMDWIVGQLMNELEELGIADNTIVMFGSDNGPEVPTVIAMRRDHDHDGARPWRGVKRDQWEGGHRTPFIVRWPNRIAAGVTSDQLMNLTDVFATCAAAVDVPVPTEAAEDSYNMLPAFLGKTKRQIRPYMLSQTISNALAIRRGNWKYLDHKGGAGSNYSKGGEWGMKQYALPEKDPEAPGQLYNLADDPGETTNLYSKHPDLVAELKKLLDESKASGRSAPAEQRVGKTAQE